MKSLLFHVHALSALHAGTGQAVGTVDLPIAREKASNLPYLPGSSLKGVLRDRMRGAPHVHSLFGPERILRNEDAFAGALAVNDARLLLLPVRSMAGVMAWATCPFVLRNYLQELAIAGIEAPAAVPEVASGQARVIASGAIVTLRDGGLLLDDLDLTAAPDPAASAWAQHLRGAVFGADAQAERHFDPRFAILADDDFSFLADTSTDVRARIRINDDTGTVDDGALWYEENLPAESVLWGLIAVGEDRSRSGHSADALRRAFRGAFDADGACALQIGGKASVGRGLVRFSLQGREAGGAG